MRTPRHIVAVSLGLLVLAVPRPVDSDDRDLLRFSTAKPYVFILLDTSLSMANQLGPGNVWVPGGGDHPDSRIYQAKQALYDVFTSVDDVHFGLATYNQDGVRAVAKHWLYFLPGTGPANWPLTFPQPDPDGNLTILIDTLEDTDGDGIPDTGDGIPDARVGDIQGDVITLGEHFPLSPVGEAGSCLAPLDLANPTDRNRVQSFAMEALSTPDETVLWLVEAGKLYILWVSLTPESPPIGSSSVNLEFHLHHVTSCLPRIDGASWHSFMTFVRDPFLSQVFINDGDPASGSDENYPGLWPWSDVLSDTDFGTSNPFTGNGWDGNYDSGVVTGDPTFDALVTDVDQFRELGARRSDLRPFEETSVSLIGRPLDAGDILPFDWANPQKQAFLRRFAPNWGNDPSAVPDFGIATYFDDVPDNKGFFQPRDLLIRPLIAIDESPLAKAINDLRCWYLGRDGAGAAGKCANSAFFDRGWESFACENDSEFGCRRTFFIIVSDGEDTQQGEDATADVAALSSHSGIRTWAINLAEPSLCESGGGLFPIVQAGKGECLTVSNRSELTTVLRSLLGEVREESRTFASAAVPGVQSTVAQRIFLGSFRPLNVESVWDGHGYAFLKPLPLLDERPDLTLCRDKANSESQCLLWDTGAQLLATPTPATTPGDLADPTKRRVFYARGGAPGTWDGRRRFFSPTTDATPAVVRYDLWTGLGIPFALDDAILGVDQLAQNRANAVVGRTLAVKSATIDTIDPNTGSPVSEAIEYLLGDAFHAPPLVLGGPPSTFYFSADLFADLGVPDATCESGDNRGYRCFFFQHQNRRRVMLSANNEGQVHGFDAGNFRVSGTDPETGKSLEDEFDNGGGKEIFAYVPRSVLPTVTELAEGDNHRYTTDGAISGADVFIDPQHGGVPTVADREWRTVVVGGLREGGAAYYALDLTQPDHLDFTGGVFLPDDLGGGNHVPSCTGNYSAANCGPVPYPSVLWEFTDSILDPTIVPPDNPVVRLDEDQNGIGDLGDTWSKVGLGRIQVCAEGGSACNPNDPAGDGDVEDRFVAIFGGGMDIDSKGQPDLATRGNWLYMVDVETGQTLYKAKLQDEAGNSGAAPSAVAAVDTDQNGVLDRIYIGTIAGRLYRVDLIPDPGTGQLPALDDPGPKTGLNGVDYSVPPRIDPALWAPRVVFDTLGPTSATDSTLVRRPIYHPPAVLFIAKLGLYGLALGTGDREDLWSLSGGAEGRFYVFADDTDLTGSPIVEADLELIAIDAADVPADFLSAPGVVPGTRGWFLTLAPEERVITDAFTLAGITVFSSFVPRIEDGSGDPVDPGCNTGGGGGGNPEEPTCSKVGNSNLFAIETTNANALLRDAALLPTRAIEVSTFVSNPYAETSTTTQDIDGGGDVADDLDQRLTDIMEGLKALFPTNCKFANYRIDIRTIAADTRVQWIAPVPVCIIDKNWQQF